MTKILGIVGSPNKNGRTNQLIQKALNGAESCGAETEKLLLSDEDIKPCQGCKIQKCWEDGICKLDESDEYRNHKLKSADGIIIGAAVYCHGINGLTKNFIDKIRIPPKARGLHTLYLPTNGKPSFAITVAGGSGKGALTSMGIIHWGFFLMCGLRALNPIPATRFNFQHALKVSEYQGKEIVSHAKNIIPFEENRIADRISFFQKMELINSDFTDDNYFLSTVLYDAVKDIPNAEVEVKEMQSNIKKARILIKKGLKSKACVYSDKAYVIGRRMWDRL